jgi:hypothetical protein
MSALHKRAQKQQTNALIQKLLLLLQQNAKIMQISHKPLLDCKARVLGALLGNYSKSSPM